MAAVLLGFLEESAEPLTLDDVKVNSKIDTDAEDDFIEKVIIPAARQLAETRTGAAIRMARYRDELPSLSRYPLSLGQMVEVETVTVDGHLLDATEYRIHDLGRETLIDAPAYVGASATLVYQAGIKDMARFPSVKSWLLLAAGWAYRHRELLIKGESLQEMPASYVDSLLVPIMQPTRC